MSIPASCECRRVLHSLAVASWRWHYQWQPKVPAVCKLLLPLTGTCWVLLSSLPVRNTYTYHLIVRWRATLVHLCATQAAYRFPCTYMVWPITICHKNQRCLWGKPNAPMFHSAVQESYLETVHIYTTLHLVIFYLFLCTVYSYISSLLAVCINVV